MSRVGSRRVTVNEAALMSRLRADTSSGVQRVVLEDLPFAAKRGDTFRTTAGSAGAKYLHIVWRP